MNRRTVTSCIACLMLLSLTVDSPAQGAAKKIRVGVYDNRAIAFAFFGSSYNPLAEKMAELEKAQAAGDSIKIRELEAWVPKFQRQIHFQGFCRAPVDDLLLLVKDELRSVVKSTGVDLISWYPDYTGEEVEIVDITDELVALFNPTQEKLKGIEDLKDTEPVALSDITEED